MERNARSLTLSYFRGSAAVLLFYSVEDLYSFSSLKQWADYAETCFQRDTSHVTWALIGNKCDEFSDISDNIVEDFCKILKSELSFKISVKSGENVISTFETIVATVHRNHQLQNIPAIEVESSLKLNLTAKQQCSCWHAVENSACYFNIIMIVFLSYVFVCQCINGHHRVKRKWSCNK